MPDQPILVLGATGTTGRRVAQLLGDSGREVRPASPSAAVRFDWEDEATWDGAIDGAGAVYLMAPDGVPVEPAFVSRATDRGVRRIVLLSSRGIEAMGDERLISAEQVVRESGAEWTIVRADWMNQNFDEGFFRDAVMGGQLAVPVGDIRQAFVDAGDIAAVASAALTDAGHAGQAYEVTGPEALTFEEAVETVGAAAGRKVQFLGGADDYLAAMEAVGLPREQLLGEVESFAGLREAGDQAPTDVVERVTGRPAKSLAAYASDAAKAGAWQSAKAGSRAR
jgi:uncharacterized protein YbjT (DUF2867 family)